MTDQQIREVLTKYEEYLSVYGIPLRHLPQDSVLSPSQAARHVLWMCGEVRKFLAEGRREKADRWLGFIQGVLWANGQYTIDDLRAHNTTPPEGVDSSPPSGVG